MHITIFVNTVLHGIPNNLLYTQLTNHNHNALYRVDALPSSSNPFIWYIPEETK